MIAFPFSRSVQHEPEKRTDKRRICQCIIANDIFKKYILVLDGYILEPLK